LRNSTYFDKNCILPYLDNAFLLIVKTTRDSYFPGPDLYPNLAHSSCGWLPLHLLNKIENKDLGTPHWFFLSLAIYMYNFDHSFTSKNYFSWLIYLQGLLFWAVPLFWSFDHIN
jgi:hypothetical protein